MKRWFFFVCLFVHRFGLQGVFCFVLGAFDVVWFCLVWFRFVLELEHIFFIQGLGVGFWESVMHARAYWTTTYSIQGQHADEIGQVYLFGDDSLSGMSSLLLRTSYPSYLPGRVNQHFERTRFV